jgi:2-methylcitrate dehydratase PrpD
MEPVLSGLARFVAGVREEAFPDAVRDRAALVLADTIGAILGGSHEAEVRRLHAGADRAPGRATILGAGFARVEPWWAIVANGLAGTMLELDEGNRFARGHPGIHVLPAALAEAERIDGSGGALLSALVAGYDVAARLGGAAPVRPGMHMHGVHGAVGAAAAVAQLRQLDERVTAGALGVAAGLTLGTSWRTALGGATVRNAYAGVAGANGWLAVDLAIAGITPLPDMLTEIFGRISGTGLDESAALAGLGERFEISRNYFKRYACCRYNHPALDALLALAAREALSAAQVERVVVTTIPFGPRMADPAPGSMLAAKFSIPYAVAAALVLGRADVPAFAEPARADPRIRALAARVEVRVDPEMSPRRADYPTAVVEVVLRDGRRRSASTTVVRGDFEDPVPAAEIVDKFLALATEPLGAARAREVVRVVEETERLEDVRDLTALLGSAA